MRVHIPNTYCNYMFGCSVQAIQSASVGEGAAVGEGTAVGEDAAVHSIDGTPISH